MKQTDFWKRFICAALAALLLAGGAATVTFADTEDETVTAVTEVTGAADDGEGPLLGEEESETLPYMVDDGNIWPEYEAEDITVTFTSFDKAVNYDFPYSDEMFSIPDEAYNHKFAQTTLGMVVAAFRSTYEGASGEDQDILAYFEQIGFKDPYTEPYKTEPTTDSIGFAIAYKVIGDKTVIAVPVCGQGYGKEWSSNLKVGNETRHVGFNEASQQVEQRIESYIASHNFTGDIILWTGGFSRAAAVSNIVAADMTDSGRFSKVFCYTFATPRTTREPGEYNNIFSIVGKDDPVPMIPFPDWGYERYGVDIFVMSREADSTFDTLYTFAPMVYYSITQRPMTVNPELNGQLRTLYSYLYALLPSAGDYVERLQPTILDYFKGEKGSDIFETVSKIISSIVPEDTEDYQIINSMIEFIEMMANQYVMQGNYWQIEEGAWDPETPLGFNLFAEHMPVRYIAYLLSSERWEDVYSEALDFTLINIRGDLDIYVIDEEGCIFAANENGRIDIDDITSYEERMTPIPSLFYQYQDGQFIICIPNDKLYLIYAENHANKEQTVEVNISDVSCVSVNPTELRGFKADLTGVEYEGISLYYDDLHKTWTAYQTGEDLKELTINSSIITPDVLMRLQNINILHLSIFVVLMILVVVLVIFVIVFIFATVLAIIRRIRHKKRTFGGTFTLHFFSLLIIFLLEMLFWYVVPAYPIIWTVFGVVAYLSIVSFSLKGERVNPMKGDIVIICVMAGVMIVLSVLGFFFAGRISETKFLIAMAIDLVFMAVGCVVWKRKQKKPPMALNPYTPQDIVSQ